MAGYGGKLSLHDGFAPVPCLTDVSNRSILPLPRCTPRTRQISRHGLIAYASTMDTPGVLTRTVRDAALLFDVLARTTPDARDDRSVRTKPTEEVCDVGVMF